MSSDKRGKQSGQHQPSADRPAAEAKQEVVASTARPDGTSSGRDKVVLTEMAAHLKTLEQKLTSQPEINQAHVDNIRKAIARGEYRINPQRVAGKMVDFESDF